MKDHETILSGTARTKSRVEFPPLRESLVSVIIPIYNAERYLAETLDSIVRQTYKNLEIICVLDAPTDGSAAIAESYAATDARIKIIRNERNMDLAESRNTGARAATGDWIHFMDADDAINPMFYRHMIVAGRGGGIDVVACNVYYEKKPRRSVWFECDEILTGRDKFTKTKAIAHGWAWRWIIRREMWIERGLSFPNLRPMEDRPAVIAMLFYARAAATCKDAIYYYKNRPGSILNAACGKEKKQRAHENRKKARRIVRDFCRENNIRPRFSQEEGNSRPVDLVYLWVNGSDPKWLAKKNAALAAAGMEVKPLDPANGAHRYFDNDELRYSLRSAAKFAPWINHIYIVTDGQRPAWLAVNPRVSVVDQSEIIPGKYLPTFNSATIECHIANIPGLADHFIYANDDMFFGGPVSPRFFFDRRGRPIIRIKSDRKHYLSRTFPGYYDNQIANAKKMIFGIFGRTHGYDWHPSHNMDPYSKPAMNAVLNDPRMRPRIEAMFARPLRGHDDVQRSVFHEYLIATRGARVRRYGPIARAWLALTGGAGQVPVMRDARKLSRMRRLPKLFCINDSGLCAVDDALSREFLERTFPEKSPFER